MKYKKKLFFIERWNWKKIIKQKEQKNNQKNKDQNWSNNKNKFLIESWNWKKNQFNKKLKKIIKWMKITLEKVIYGKLELKNKIKNE